MGASLFENNYAQKPPSGFAVDSRSIKMKVLDTLLDINDVVPSAFTSTEYTLLEVDDVMSTDFFV